MKRIRDTFIYWLVLLAQIAYVHCECELRVEGPSPLFQKKYGSKKIVFKLEGNLLRLGNNETINALCSTGSSLLLNFNLRNLKKPIAEPPKSNLRSALFYCDPDNRIEFKRDNETGTSFTATDYSAISLSCSSRVSPNMFEAIERKLPNCEKYSNYALGVKLTQQDDIVQMGICYDLEKLQLKFVNYVGYGSLRTFTFDEMNMTNPLQIALENRLDGLNNYFKFMSAVDFGKSLEKLRTEKPLLQSFDFDFESILQDAPIANEFNNFTYFFNMVWWRQLRRYNWRYFLEALLERSKVKKYVVYVGTFGNATLPAATITHHKYETLTIQSENSEVTAPAYIWAYLRSLDSSSAPEELVVMAMNSPFALSPSTQVLCKDICDEIDWLAKSKFGSLRKTPTLGAAFCCRPQDVAPLIDSFPWQPPRSSQPQTEMKMGPAKPVTEPEQLKSKQSESNAIVPVQLGVEVKKEH